MGTRGRLTLVHTAVLLAAILVADAGIYLVLSSVEHSAADDVLRSQALTISSGIEDVNGQVRFGGGDLPTETQQGVAVDAGIVAADGSITLSSAQNLPASTLRAIAAQARNSSQPVFRSARDTHGVDRRIFAESLRGTQGSSAVLVVSRSLTEADATLQRYLVALAGFSVLIVAAASVLAHRLTGRVLLPVRQIASTARDLSQHDLHRRVDIDVPPDELGELVETFNAMLARLESSFESLRRFTADASHELRSPLALMRSELENARQRPRTVDEYRALLAGLEAEVDRMARMADQMLMLARADAGALRPASEPVDVADLVHEVTARWTTVAKAARVTIEVEAPETGTVAADADLLHRVLDNLVDNAIRHAPRGSVVRVSGTRAPDSWLLAVRDHGPGVPPAARAHLFDRFASTDPARERNGGGAGLGLALSRAIAEAHGGSLELAPDLDGAMFTLRLPVETSSKSR